VIGWLVAIGATASIGGAVAPKQATETEMIRGEARTATERAIDAGAVDPIVESIMVTSADGGPLNLEAGAAALAELGATLSALPQVAMVAPQPIPDTAGDALLLQVQLNTTTETALEDVAPVLDATATADAAHPDLTIREAGQASITREANDLLLADLGRATMTSVPVTLVILLVAFGAIIMAGLPVILAIGAVASGFGLWAVASQVFPDQGMVQHVIVLMGMAVGVDYSLFFLRRFREEIHERSDRLAAIAAAADTAGHSVIVSGTAVSLALAATLFLGDTFFSGMGAGAILVVLVAVGSSVTALPALVVWLARFIDRPRLPWLWRLTNRSDPRVMPALLRPVVRHPALAVVGAIAILAVLALPMAGMKLKLTGVEDMPRSLESMVVYDDIVHRYPAESTADRIVVTFPADTEVNPQATVVTLAGALAEHPDLYGELAGVFTAPDGRTLIIDVQTLTGDDGALDAASVTTLREEILPATFGQIPGAQAYVGGVAAINLDYTAHLRAQLVPLVAIVIAVTFCFMFAVYRSLAIGVITVLLNLLSAVAAFGLVTFVFQRRWAEGILGFTSNGTVVSWVPLLLFVILCGLSLDYHVFVLSRIQEGVRAGLPTREAVFAGVVRTAGVVTSAAAVMVGVFAIFGTLSFLELKQMGVGLGVAILLDATVIRIIALPAMLVLARRFLWWPGRSARALAAADAVPRLPQPRTVRQSGAAAGAETPGEAGAASLPGGTPVPGPTGVVRPDEPVPPAGPAGSSRGAGVGTAGAGAGGVRTPSVGTADLGTPGAGTGGTDEAEFQAPGLQKPRPAEPDAAAAGSSLHWTPRPAPPIPPWLATLRSRAATEALDGTLTAPPPPDAAAGPAVVPASGESGPETTSAAGRISTAATDASEFAGLGAAGGAPGEAADVATAAKADASAGADPATSEEPASAWRTWSPPPRPPWLQAALARIGLTTEGDTPAEADSPAGSSPAGSGTGEADPASGQPTPAAVDSEPESGDQSSQEFALTPPSSGAGVEPAGTPATAPPPTPLSVAAKPDSGIDPRASAATALPRPGLTPAGAPRIATELPPPPPPTPADVAAWRTTGSAAHSGRNTVLALTGVSKTLGERRPLRDVTLEVRAGEVLAITGPDGGGKGELAEILAGRRIAGRGTVALMGEDVTLGGWAFRTSVLTAPRDALVTSSDTVRRNLVVGAGRLGGGTDPGARAADLIVRFGLSDVAELPAGECSAGQQRVVALAKCIAAGAKLTILTDPTLGLGERQSQTVADAIVGLAAEGMTFVLVSHDPAEAEAMADRVVVLDRAVVAEGTPSELVARHAPGALVTAQVAPPERVEELAAALERANLTTVEIRRREGQVTARTEAGLATFAQLSTALAASGWDLTRLALHPATLTDVVAKLRRDQQPAD
jgi:RND superfamily putative drug exporter